MSETSRGILAISFASALWGVIGLFYNTLAHVPPLEVLAHRTIWSMVFFGAVLLLRGRFGAVFVALRDRKNLATIALAAVMVAINWGAFISAIQFNHALEASLGYYIFPLMVVALGLMFFGEHLTTLQKYSVGLIVGAVVLLTFGLGAPPWISLIIASTFSMYALLKKRLDTGPVVSVFVEVLLLSPLALVWLAGVHGAGWALVDRPTGWFGRDTQTTLLLLATGPLTAGPLILFSYAAKRVTLSTLGLIQYLNPSMQFLVAVFIFAEGLTVWHASALPVIWLALAIYSFDIWRREKRDKAARVSAPRPRPGG